MNDELRDRKSRARAEAERYMNRVMPYDTMADHYSAIAAFVDGALWADAHPQPRAITRAEFAEAFARAGTNEATAILRELGIEVRDE